MKRIAVTLFVAAGLALLSSVYLYTFCVPLESACHMGDGHACERLARTLRAAAWLGGSALALALATAALVLWRRALGVSARSRAGSRAST